MGPKKSKSKRRRTVPVYRVRRKTRGQELYDRPPIVIQALHICMDFDRAVNEYSSIKELMIQTVKGQRVKEKYRALDDVSFDIRKGSVVGVIGTNGAGKSTLLKIISGALAPTSGIIRVNKSKVQILTLGTGFDMELTGRENVYLNGAIIGYSKKFIDKHYEKIVEFAELQDFMDEKVKNYSSGMVSRLGFAIATAGPAPEILILDEILSVGDQFFRQKSLQRIKELIHGGSTVLMVSHSTGTIRENCDKAIWLEKGHMIAMGEAKDIC
ncbi:MAG: ABC transporter ATP-binding protein, partial [Clostridium sp.]|nr:ABC transporter ATP-binding protein [Clostridium sp.]